MLSQEPHLSDQDLVMAADGELSDRRAKAVRRHLAQCPRCRQRMAETTGAIMDFERLHHEDLDPRLASVAGPRALLKARLAEASAPSKMSFGARLSGFPGQRAAGILAFTAVAGAMVLLVALVERPAARLEAGVAPRPQLTPGDAAPLTREDVCTGRSFTQAAVVPASLKRQVFEAYGIRNPKPDAYEVDYLITPELGGATSLRNLWPQPYYTSWDARVKDQLEERLHAMVCSGEIDLQTAQREIAADWISAYKKYFHTETPLVKRPIG